MASDTSQPQTRQRSSQSPTTNIVAAAASDAAAAVLPQTSSKATYAVHLMNIVGRLRRHFLGQNIIQTPELIRLYFSVAKSIDYAISIGDVPHVAPHLPFIIKQVYQHRSSAVLSAIIFLVIAAKSACQNGWFPDAVADEILSMNKELYDGVCRISTPNETMALGSDLDIISKLIERFYPQMQLCRLVISLEAKPGYDILMGDFHIKRDKSPEEKIRLFVAQKDNLETSSCVISPAHVSFLVNGKGVDGRTNCRMASGPQFPTDITRMLKYGANIIQAVGVFNSAYVIAVAHTVDIAAPAPALKDYVQPVARSVADADVTEGPSRIMLKCPISFRRIKTPVKGYQCKHHQCFDYDNFMQMNARRPFWRCPCCNQPVSFIDLRVDQGMIKILREVAEDVNDVLIYADGSWNMLPKHESNLDQSLKATSVQQNDDIESKYNENTNTMSNLVDLTKEDGNYVYQLEDMKLFKDSRALNLSPPAPIAPESTGLQSTCHQLGITIVPGVVSCSNGMPASARRPDASAGTLESLIPGLAMNPLGTHGGYTNGFSTSFTGTNSNLLGTLESLVSSAVRNPVTTDSLSLPRELDYAAAMGIPNPTFCQETLAGQNGASMQLQQPSCQNYINNSTIQRSSIPNHVNGAPNEVRVLSSRSRPPAVNQATRYQVVVDHHQVLKPSAEQIIGNPINTSMYSGQLRGAGLHLAPSQSPSLFNSRVRPSQNGAANASLSQLLAMQAQQMLQNRSNLTNIQNHLFARMAQASRPQPVESVNLSTRRVTTPQPPELPPGQNWRPTGRLRGSLHGAAFDEALSQYLTPSQTGTPGPGNWPGS